MAAREDGSSDAIKREIVALLKAHRDEIEDAIIARMESLGDSSSPDNVLTSEVLAGFRPAAVESVNSMVNSFEEGDEWTPTLSPAIAANVQRLARAGAPLETVLSGFVLVGGVFFEFLAEKLSQPPHAPDALPYLMSWQRQHGDSLMNAFVAEYTKEVERLNRSPSRHLKKHVQKLLAGESGAEIQVRLGYPLQANHVGLIAAGPNAELECRTLAESLGCDLLAVPHGEETVWAWFGSSRGIDLGRLGELAGRNGSLSLAAGEPRDGVDGWRLSHREAQATLPVALLEPPGLTRYSDVALVADALRNEATGKALIDRYLGPWSQHRDGERLRATVRTYLDSDCNAASTASALKVNRHTVQRRLRKVEEAIGEPLSARRAELDVALRLERLTERATENDASRNES